MNYYRNDKDGYLLGIGENGFGTELSKSEYDGIAEIVGNKPPRTETTDYRLKSDLTWESYQIEPSPDEPTVEDKAEAYDILMGVTA